MIIHPQKSVPLGRRAIHGWVLPVAALLALSSVIACISADNHNGRLREISPVREARDGRFIKSTLTAELPLGAPPRNFIFAGNALYVFLNREGVAVLDIADTAMPKPTGLIDERQRHPELAPHFFLGGWVDGNRLIIVNRHHGLAVYNIADPLHPRYLISHPMPYNDLVPGMRLDEDYIIPAGSHGLYRTSRDLSHTATPDQLIEHFDYVKGVKFYPPHWLLMADDYDYGMQVIDVSHHDAPRLAIAYNTGNHCDEIEVFKGFVVINNRNLGVLFLGMKHPWQPELLSYMLVGPSSGVRAVHKLDENRLIVGYASGYFDVLDVKDPRHPLWLGRVPVGTDINCISSRGNIVYVGLNNPPWEPSERTAMQLKVFRLEEGQR